MEQLRRFQLAILPGSVLLLGLVSFSSPPAQSGFSTQEQLKDDLNVVPCKDGDRLNAVRSLFERMGADPSDVLIEKYKNVQNLVIRKAGASDDKIVVGAHYDKVSLGCGALDNWTGIVAMAHIYKTLKPIVLNKTILFVAFGKEEEGLVGSRAMAAAIGKEQVATYCAMVNIDSLGLGIPQVADNMSSKKLMELAAEMAKKMSMQFGHATVEGGLSDSNSFTSRRIPALTIHGMTDEWRSVLHSVADQPSKVNPVSVYLGYRLALAVVYSIDKTGCDAYR